MREHVSSCLIRAWTFSRCLSLSDSDLTATDLTFTNFMLCIGSRRWNWKFREKHFWNPNPELLLHSSYSFWSYLSTSSSGWDSACPLPLVDSSGQKLSLECNRSSGFGFQTCFPRNFQFLRRGPSYIIDWPFRLP